MYIPNSFNITDLPSLHAFIRSNSFATLVTNGVDGLTATHLPLLLDPDAGPRGTLIGHLARANPQRRSLTGEVMVIFQGPHAYISPTWYETPGTVPTWNYVAVHAYGKGELVEDRRELHAMLTRLVDRYERGRPAPWSHDPADPALDAMLDAIVGFRVEIERLEGKAKLNQNHPEERRRKVVAALEQSADENDRAVAALMSAGLPRINSHDGKSGS